jgi:hypothetical protein
MKRNRRARGSLRCKDMPHRPLLIASTIVLLASCIVGSPQRSASLPPPPATSGPTPHQPRNAFPGGGRILFQVSNAPGFNGQGIGVLRADGTLQTFPAGMFQFAYWDPASSGRILTLSSGKWPSARSYRIASSGLRPMDSWPVSDGNFTFPSLDGRYLAFVPFSRKGILKTGVVHVIDRESGATRVLHRGPLVPRTWTPDGRIVASPWDGAGPAVLWNPRTGRTQPFPIGRGVDLSSISWSPDGTLFAARAGHRSGKIVLGTAAGITVRTINVGTRMDSVPSWSPDGKKIAYLVPGSSRRPERNGTLHVYQPSSSKDSIVATDVSDGFWASWSPNGRWLMLQDWTRDRWLFVSVASGRRIAYPWLGNSTRWCCPSSPPISTQVPVS